MKIEIWSDIACPFCYIGKRKFEQALEGFAHKDDVQVAWRSFQLDPDMDNVPGKSIHEVLAAKKGISVAQAKSMGSQVSEIASAVGLTFNMDKTVPANTFDAHRLTHLAAKYDLEDAAEERLFRAYFTEGKNIQDRETLVQLGVEIGLDEQDVRNTLGSDNYAYEVRTEGYEAQQIGVRGVPFFVIDRKYAVSGAQPSEVFLQALQKARTEWEKEHEAASLVAAEGAACSIDGNC